MKQYLHAFAMCQSMFCAIPSPFHVWDEEARPKMLLFLPVVGLEIGLLWWGIAGLAAFLKLPELVRGLVIALWPFLATGYLHLDGFMDVTDAVKSCRSLERRREILKDSHVGAFAVINVVMLMLGQFAFAASAQGDWRILIFVPVVSRCGSALAVTLLRPMSTSQYASQNINRNHAVVLGLMLICAVAGGFLLCGRYGFVPVGGILGYLMALRKGYRSLEGMNGDISGYALTVSELCSLAVFAVI